jgi:type II secretory pathway pseudopilin PulG
MTNHPSLERRVEAGFTLLEVMIAAIVMTIGVLSLAVMLAMGMAYMGTSQLDYIAQEKAAEAAESIFTARDMGQATWATICNVGSNVCPNGIFVNGPAALCDPGPDGIVGTADDYSGATCAVAADAILMPKGSTINNTTNTRMPLSNYNFQRTITITAYPNMLNVRQITVVITYQSGHFNRSYTLTTNISNFS